MSLRLAAAARRVGARGEIRFDEARRRLRVRRTGGEVLCNFDDQPVQLPIERGRHVVLSTHAETNAAEQKSAITLPPLAGALVA